MIRIIQHTQEPIINIEEITDTMFIGLVVNNNRYIIISKMPEISGYGYLRMNNSLTVVGNSFITQKDLLKKVELSEAFVFNTKQELIAWLLNS